MKQKKVEPMDNNLIEINTLKTQLSWLQRDKEILIAKLEATEKFYKETLGIVFASVMCRVEK